MGALTGVGTSISYVDQNRTAPRVQQYSAGIQQELPGHMALTVSYMGARGDHMPLGGTADTALNVNQLDPKYMALGSQLNAALPNPFFGNAAAGPLSTQATLTRAQLLRPYPQFLNVSARQVSEGITRYNAGVIEWVAADGRQQLVWRPRQLHLQRPQGQPVRRGQFLLERRFRPAAEQLQLHRGLALLQPARGLRLRHPRRAASPRDRADRRGAVRRGPALVVVERADRPRSPAAGRRRRSSPFRAASRLACSRATTPARSAARSGRTSSTASIGRRPGDWTDRLASANHAAATWLNPAAFTTAPANTFGNAPRTITDVRTPPQQNVDLSVSKNIRLGGTRFAQIRVEVVNLLNRVTTSGIATTAGNSSFGQISSQSGFMRLTQFSFRYSF